MPHMRVGFSVFNSQAPIRPIKKTTQNPDRSHLKSPIKFQGWQVDVTNFGKDSQEITGIYGIPNKGDDGQVFVNTNNKDILIGRSEDLETIMDDYNQGVLDIGDPNLAHTIQFGLEETTLSDEPVKQRGKLKDLDRPKVNAAYTTLAQKDGPIHDFIEAAGVVQDMSGELTLEE